MVIIKKNYYVELENMWGAFYFCFDYILFFRGFSENEGCNRKMGVYSFTNRYEHNFLARIKINAFKIFLINGGRLLKYATIWILQNQPFIDI